MTVETKRPEGMTEDHLEYLDTLRESGATNMFGAGSYLTERFGLSQNTASKYLAYWMETFEARHA